MSVTEFSRRRFNLAVTAAASTVCTPLLAQSAWPNKPIRIIVPYTPGGFTDQMARIVQVGLQNRLQQTVTIDNKPGANSIIGVDMLAKAPADGSTFAVVIAAYAANNTLYPKLPYDARRDLTGVSLMGVSPLLAAVNNDAPFKTAKELIAYARANPGKLNIGTINVGSTQNLAGELFKSAAGIDAQIVPFKGTPALITALRGGEIDIAVEILGPVMSQINAKAVRVLAVMGEKRHDGLPDVPTVREAGIAGFNVASWNALAAPARTPREVLARLNKEVVAAVNSPAVRQRLKELGVEARAGSPEQLHDLLVAEIKRWTEVINRAKIEKQ